MGFRLGSHPEMDFVRTLYRLAPAEVKNWYRRITQSNRHLADQEMERLHWMPRYTETITNLLGSPFALVDSVSFLAQYRVIFEREKYRFQAKRPDPVILDCGANIGMMSIYWKQLY